MPPDQPFIFEGHWETEHTFSAFAGLQSRRGAYMSQDRTQVSDGTVRLYIDDLLNDDPDPSPTQLKAIEYLSKNPEKIRQILFKALAKEYPKLQELYGYDASDPDHQEWFPPVNELTDFATTFGVGNVFILSEEKDGFAYVGFECGCTWDDEHGLGFMLHRDRLVNIGQADAAFNTWNAKEHGGLDRQTELYEAQKKRLPQIYQPHPKYGILKPKQEEENKMYENRLIERGFNQEFIRLVEAGKIDIYKNPGLNMSFAQRAVQFNNSEILEYLVGQQGFPAKGLIYDTVNHLNRELVLFLLKHGAKLQEKDSWGRTLSDLVEQRIRHSEQRQTYQAFADWLQQLETDTGKRWWKLW